MIKLIDLLKEAKQVGTLYHFTPLSNLKSILANRHLFNNDEGQISTSIRANMGTRGFYSMGKNPIARIMLDGDKISNKYKIRPFSHGGDEDNPEDLGEEQIVVNGKKFYFIPYLKRVDIFLNKKEKIDNKIIELLEKANIPYKIYQGTPDSNIPYTQPKDGNPEDINIEKIPKKEIYTSDDMYFLGMKTKMIDLYDMKPAPHSSAMKIKVGISSQYPGYYLLPSYSVLKDKIQYFNLNKEKIDMEFIPLPMYNDPKWRKMWNSVEPPDTGFKEGNICDAYILIPQDNII
jgi:hypothetical protein